jgi:hypothetical protein
MTSPTAKQIWDTLSQYDVAPLVEKKNGFDYLSWANAWAILMRTYPEATFEFLTTDGFNELFYANQDTAEVRCEITIGSVVRTMSLPVMDMRNKSIELPTSDEVNKAKMRCLVKCLALFGLGIKVFGGDDLPSDDITRPTPRPNTRPEGRR